MNPKNRMLLYVLVASLFIMPLAGTKGARNAVEKNPVRIAYANWASSVASANLAKAVFQEKLGIDCELVPMPIDMIWMAVAEGDVDAMLSAWLPDTHAHFKEQFGEQVIDLGPNLFGTRTGLVVPAIIPGRTATGPGIREPYITIDSIYELRDYAEKFNYRIIGIEREAGITRQTEKAMNAYGLAGFDLVESSEAEMIMALSRAIPHQQWIVITGWIPHWIFARWNLKFLDDPQNIYGEKGHINTIVRVGLKEDRPQAFRFLNNFQWTPEEIGQLMLWIEEDKGRFPYDKALRWIRTHPDRVENWISETGF